MNAIGNRRAWMAALLATGVMLCTAACGQSPARQTKGAAKAAPAVPAAYQDAARSTLGDDAKVILSGDLAHNGHIQLLIVARLPKTPDNVVPGLIVSRAAILEKHGSDWREIFLADAQLKNSKGYLAGTPLAAVGAWRLQYEQHADGLEMYFTPLQQPGMEHPRTIEVRWNRAVRRYQSLDRNYKHFLSEASTLGPTPEFQMKQ